MNFLKWYSLILVTIAVVLCIFSAKDSYEFIGGLMFIPVAIYLWSKTLAK